MRISRKLVLLFTVSFFATLIQSTNSIAVVNDTSEEKNIEINVKAGTFAMFAGLNGHGYYTCSGVQDPNTYGSGTRIITATHCLNGVKGQGIKKVAWTNSSKLPGYLGKGFDVSKYDYYSVLSTQKAKNDETDLGNDISVLRIHSVKGIYPSAINSYKIPTQNQLNGLTLDDKFVVAGFGYTARGPMSIKKWLTWLRSNNVNYSTVTVGFLSLNSTQITEDITQDNGWGAACIGDSGGPNFVNIDNTTYLAGITSTGDDECEKTNVISRLDTTIYKH